MDQQPFDRKPAFGGQNPPPEAPEMQQSPAGSAAQDAMDRVRTTLDALDAPLGMSRLLLTAAIGTAALVVLVVYLSVSKHLLLQEGVAVYGSVFLFLLSFAALSHHRTKTISARLQQSAQHLLAAEQHLIRTTAEAENLQRLLVDAVNSVDEGFILFDANNLLVVCNERYRSAYPTIADLLVPGTSFATILATAAQRLGVAGESSPQDLKYWVEDRMRRHIHTSAPLECALADGRWYRISERPTRAGGIVKILSDITATKHHQQELANKSEVLESTFDAMAQGVAVFDHNNCLLTWNDHLPSVMEYSGDLLQTGTPVQAFRNFDEQRGARILPRPDGSMPFLASGTDISTSFDHLPFYQQAQDHQAELELPDGRHVEIRASGMPRGGMVVTFADITARRQTRSALQHAQKMDAIGQLAGGIAHEFNNMLTSIGGFARMALRSPDDPERVVMCLGEVTKAADRAASLTSQLLNFSRRSLGEEQRPIRLKDMLRNLTNFLRPLLGARVDVAVHIDDPDLVVLGDAVKLHQAIVNLCINARDAMPNGGDIALTLSRLSPELPILDRHPSLDPAQTYAAIIVTDQGTGIEPALIARIFEPFFTTKDQGKGTGLGLPMVYSVAEHMGGVIDVASEVGEGSTFTLILPLANCPTQPVPRPHDEEHFSFNGDGLTILLAEDEDAVRRLITLTLEEADCTVLTAANGDEAVKIFEQDQDAIDLLISDVVMPGTDGPTLARMVLDMNQDLKVILMSGYSATDDWKSLTEGPGRAFLSKPVDPEHLLAAVQAVMRSAE